MKHLAQSINHRLCAAKKVLIVPHQHPDADALGSAAALYEYLKQTGITADIFCVTAPNEKLHFIPHSDRVVTDRTAWQDREVDTVVVVDAGDLRYAGIADLVKGHRAEIIVIDHHITNERYGHFNLVVPTASSTAEILYHFFQHNHIPINERMATALLAGLTTDTGNFTNSATSARAFAIGGELVRSGGNLNRVTEATIKNKPIAALQLWGRALSRLTTDETSGITHTYLTQADFTDCGVPDNESEGVANFLNNLESSPIALILKETTDGAVKGSFRTTRDDVDVASLAKQLGGGGHKKAAGFTITGTIPEVLQKILTMDK